MGIYGIIIIIKIIIEKGIESINIQKIINK